MSTEITYMTTSSTIWDEAGNRQVRYHVSGSNYDYTDPKPYRDFNKHRTGESYYNSRAWGDGYLPFTFPWGGVEYPISKASTSHSEYLETVTEGKLYYLWLCDAGPHATVQLIGCYISLGADGLWRIGGNFTATETVSIDFWPESQWRKETDLWYVVGRRNNGRCKESLYKNPNAYGSYEEAYAALLNDSVLMRSPRDFCLVYGLTYTTTWLDVHGFSGQVNPGNAAWDPHFSRFAKIRSYDALHVDDRRHLCEAYLKAIEGIPSALHTDNLENAIQLINLAKDIIVSKGRPAKLAGATKEIKNLWLSARYSLKTTLTDIEEANRYLEAASNLIGEQYIKSDGDVVEDGVHYHVTIVWTPQGLKSLQSWPERVGIDARPSHIWDLIPYSFMVDWFLQVGNLLEFAETRTLSLKAEPDDVWMSIAKTGKNQWGEDQSDYIRLHGLPTRSDLAFLPDYSWYHPNGGVVAKHAADAAAILLP